MKIKQLISEFYKFPKEIAVFSKEDYYLHGSKTNETLIKNTFLSAILKISAVLDCKNKKIVAFFPLNKYRNLLKLLETQSVSVQKTIDKYFHLLNGSNTVFFIYSKVFFDNMFVFKTLLSQFAEPEQGSTINTVESDPSTESPFTLFFQELFSISPDNKAKSAILDKTESLLRKADEQARKRGETSKFCFFDYKDNVLLHKIVQQALKIQSETEDFHDSAAIYLLSKLEEDNFYLSFRTIELFLQFAYKSASLEDKSLFDSIHLFLVKVAVHGKLKGIPSVKFHYLLKEFSTFATKRKKESIKKVLNI